MSIRKYVVWTLAGFGLLTFVLWFSAAGAASTFFCDTPIIVKNGSIVRESQGVDFSTWAKIDKHTMHHPHQDKAFGDVEVTGGQNATCSGKGRCVITAQWSTGQKVRILALAAGSKGLRLESSVDINHK